MIVYKVVRGCVDIVVWHRLARCWRLARYPRHCSGIGGAKDGVLEVVSATSGGGGNG